MVTLQELIARGRFLFSGAEKRLRVFTLINGKLTTKEIARQVGKSQTNTLSDIKKLCNLDLVKERTDASGKTIKKDGATIFEKTPLAKEIPITYFKGVAKQTAPKKEATAKKAKKHSTSKISTPTENEILDICKDGENQLYEFKASGTRIDKITKEIAAFLHTKYGGIIFYGVDDDGSIQGSDTKRQVFDQPLQNSVRNSIAPSPSIELKEKIVMGYPVLLIIIRPWDKKSIYQYSEKYYIRKGTNTFVLKPEEMKKLHDGKYVV